MGFGNLRLTHCPISFFFFCQDGREASGLIVAAMFVFCKLFKNPTGAADMFSIRRCGIGHKVSLTASQER